MTSDADAAIKYAQASEGLGRLHTVVAQPTERT